MAPPKFEAIYAALRRFTPFVGNKCNCQVQCGTGFERRKKIAGMDCRTSQTVTSNLSEDVATAVAKNAHATPARPACNAMAGLTPGAHTNGLSINRQSQAAMRPRFSHTLDISMFWQKLPSMSHAVPSHQFNELIDITKLNLL